MRLRVPRSAARTYLAACLIPAAVAALLGVARPGLLLRLQDQLFDGYQRLAPGRYDAAAAPVRIVDIDDASLAAVGQWPWPRTVIARLVDRLGAAGAAAIGFDMVFAEADRTSPEAFLAAVTDENRRGAVAAALGDTPGHDAVLAKTLRGNGVVLGMVLTQAGRAPAAPPPLAGWGIAYAGEDPARFVPGFGGSVVPLAVLREEAAGLGALNWLPDGDQTVRRVPLLLRLGGGTGSATGRLVPSLALESLRVALGASTFTVRASAAGVEAVRVGDVAAESGADGDIRLLFTPHRPERFLAAAAVLDGGFDPALVRDRIVIVGSSAAGLADIRATPLDPAMPGVEIQAQAVESLLSGSRLTRFRYPGLEVACGLVLALLLAAALPRLPAPAGMTLALAALGAVAGLSWAAFARLHLLVDPLAPGAVIAAATAGAITALFRTEQQGRRFVQAAFGRFVSPAVVARLAADPAALTLGGEQRELTVMFTDVRDFSAIAERMEPRQLLDFMNRYLSPMTDIVLERRGTIDKYIGDAVMAFWNAPLPDADHAGNAARAALAMLAALPDIPADASGPLRIGIGIATGPCVVGTFGSSLRFDYSAVGDDVNLASRLESLSKLYGVAVLASEATVRAAPGFAWLEVDEVVVMGRAGATRLFTLLGDEAVARDAAFAVLRGDHAALRHAYRAGRFGEAAAACAALRARSEALASFYDMLAARCGRLAAEPPAGWDGITRMERK